MDIHVDVQNASSSTAPLPEDEDIHRWISAALKHSGNNKSNTTNRSYEVSVRIVDVDEITRLNQQYRQKAQATNVLSFPTEFPADVAVPLLGDIVVCADVVAEEAEQQRKAVAAHWAHMLVHGTLHLLGYDHIDDSEADIMEALESEILTELDYPAPYQ